MCRLWIHTAEIDKLLIKDDDICDPMFCITHYINRFLG